MLNPEEGAQMKTFVEPFMIFVNARVNNHQFLLLFGRPKSKAETQL